MTALRGKVSELERAAAQRKAKLDENSAFLQFNWKADVVESWIGRTPYYRHTTMLTIHTHHHAYHTHCTILNPLHPLTKDGFIQHNGFRKRERLFQIVVYM